MATPDPSPSASEQACNLPPPSIPALINPIQYHYSINPNLDDTNFLLWKSQVLPMIRGHGLFSFLDGTAHSSGSEPWNRQEHLILAWLLSSLGSLILPQAINCQTLAELWSMVHHVYSAQSQSKMLYLNHWALSHLRPKPAFLILLLRSQFRIMLLARLLDLLLILVLFLHLCCSTLFPGNPNNNWQLPMLLNNSSVVAIKVDRGVVVARAKVVLPAIMGKGPSLDVQCQICTKIGHTTKECWYCYDDDPNAFPQVNLAQPAFSPQAD